ncbi:hypothetical protein [Clostridium estertheticum]|uniref:Phage tail protein n=1 Tax=Clostridium estertheticum subsp. estertheticum TaxID=1552 RepID=A0A1J0GIA0_9CLOT|nr:hypothetical protein [Clostridium estertheticum]APC41053.1 hypothetical protein A7L45_13700 [Clostridium estertheticum subsp. estertheticum]
MEIRIELYEKTITGGYYATPRILRNDEIMNINISRRIFELGTCSCLIDNTARDKNLTDIVNFTGLGFYDNHNQVKVYIDDEIAFIGVLKEYKYDEDNNTYYFRAEDMLYKIFRTIDATPSLIYENTTAKQVIIHLFKNAGISDVRFSDEVVDYDVKKIKVEYNNTYVDVLDKFFNVMYARFNCNRDGSVDIVKAFKNYDGTPIIKYKLESMDFISTGEYSRNENDIRNKVIVKANDSDVQAFVCPYLVDHMNNEIYLDVIDEDLANTLEKKRNVARRYFRDKLRHAKKFSLTTIDGSLDRDVGDMTRIFMNQNKVQGWAIVNGINTSIQDGIWQDTLEIEVVVGDKWIEPLAVGGNYIIKD